MVNIFKKIKELRKRRWWRSYEAMLSAPDARERFRLIYEKNLWRNSQSASGSGSTRKFTRNIRKAIPEVVSKLQIRSIFDAPCGDLNWMRLVLREIDVDYIGADIVPQLIEENRKRIRRPNTEFLLLDLTSDPFPRTDLMICRDCLFHFSFQDTLSLFENFIQSGTTYFFSTSSDRPDDWSNEDILTGSFRPIDLHRPPYHLDRRVAFSALDGKPDNKDRHMKLWHRDQIMTAVAQMKTDLQRDGLIQEDSSSSFRNSYPDISVMQSAKDVHGDHGGNPLNGSP